MRKDFEENVSLTCRSCGMAPVRGFHEVKAVPVQSVLNIPERKKAREFPTGTISLGFCPHCGFISNTAFKPELLAYDTGYEATQSYSSTFNEFARKQASSLIERFNLHGKDLVEIGCGHGEFLTLLCELGDNRGVGFDPAYVEGRVPHKKGLAVKFIKDYYSQTNAIPKVDFLYCKMTLEHIHDSGAFINMVRESVDSRMETTVFFQVPDVTRILSECAFEDIYYEHCSYFSPGSLAGLFRRNGFEVLNIETDYAGQYVMIDAKPRDKQEDAVLPGESDLERLKQLVDQFPEKLEGKLFKWRERLGRIKAQNNRTVIWGSGSKGVAFLTTLGINEEVKYAVDINPYRQGTYMAGTGHEIVSPGFMKEYRPDVVIVMNAVYKEEISRELSGMGLASEIWLV